MTDEFSEIMEAGRFSPDSFEEGTIAQTGVLPTSVDDHSAVHLVEALLQFTVFFYQQDYVIDAVEPVAPGVARALEIGLQAYNDEYRRTRGAGPITFEAIRDPVDIEFLAWVRLAAGQMALALDKFIHGLGLKKVTVMVYLSGHGFYPFTMGEGFGNEVPGL